MKIENTPLAASLLQEAGSKPKPAEPGRPSPGPSVVTNISRALVSSADDIDMDKVNAMRVAIQEGKLQIDTDRIAGSLLASMADLL